jgi:hypothetical protein
MTPFPSESIIGAKVVVLALPVVVIAAIVELELPEVLKLNCVPAGHVWLKNTLNRLVTDVFKSASDTSSISDPSWRTHDKSVVAVALVGKRIVPVAPNIGTT